MVQRRNHQGGKQQRRRAAQSLPVARPAPEIFGPKPKVIYGKPVILLEDSKKQVFVYSGSQWVSYEKSIAECRLDCQVKELSQKINGRTRYEVCSPVE